MPGGHMPSGGANLGNRGYPGAVGQGGYPHQSAGAHQAHLSHQQKELLKEQVQINIRVRRGELGFFFVFLKKNKIG